MMFDPTTSPPESEEGRCGGGLDTPNHGRRPGLTQMSERGGRKTAGRPKGPAPSSRNADGSKPSCMVVAAPVVVGIGFAVAALVRGVR